MSPSAEDEMSGRNSTGPQFTDWKNYQHQISNFSNSTIFYTQYDYIYAGYGIIRYVRKHISQF